MGLEGLNVFKRWQQPVSTETTAPAQPISPNEQRRDEMRALAETTRKNPMTYEFKPKFEMDLLRTLKQERQRRVDELTSVEPLANRFPQNK
jgi:hypothetical protein